MMLINDKILPILENTQFCNDANFNVPLFATAMVNAAFPAISFALNSDYGTPVLVEDTDDVGLTGSGLVRESFKNLTEIPIKWQVQMLHNRPIIVAEEAWASEKILDKAFLLQASFLLESEEILVAIPKRGMILATSAKQMDAVLDFGLYASECFEDMSSYPLSNTLFLIEKGKITGTLSINSPKKPVSGAAKNAVVIKVRNDISTRIVKKSNSQGTESYIVTLGAQDFRDFVNAAYQIIVNILSTNVDNPNFNGLIEFNILSEWLPQSADFDSTLTQFLERMRRQTTLSDAAYELRKDIAITFAHLSDSKLEKPQPKRRLKIACH
jgi:hypothetical protein